MSVDSLDFRKDAYSTNTPYANDSKEKKTYPANYSHSIYLDRSPLTVREYFWHTNIKG